MKSHYSAPGRKDETFSNNSGWWLSEADRVHCFGFSCSHKGAQLVPSPIAAEAMTDLVNMNNENWNFWSNPDADPCRLKRKPLLGMVEGHYQ